MAKRRYAVEWRASGVTYIEANSLERAEALVDEMSDQELLAQCDWPTLDIESITEDGDVK